MEDHLDMQNFYEGQLKELQRKIENEKMKEACDAAAKTLRNYYDSMIKAGFTEKQAWWFTTAVVREAWKLS